MGINPLSSIDLSSVSPELNLAHYDDFHGRKIMSKASGINVDVEEAFEMTMKENRLNKSNELTNVTLFTVYLYTLT